MNNGRGRSLKGEVQKETTLKWEVLGARVVKETLWRGRNFFLQAFL